MIATGKCPKCEATISAVIVAVKWKGASFLCPSCKTVLGVGMDPLALKTDTIKGVARALGKS